MKKVMFFMIFMPILLGLGGLAKSAEQSKLIETFENITDGQEVCFYHGTICNKTEEICSKEHKRCFNYFPGLTAEEIDEKCLEIVKKKKAEHKGVLDMCRYRLGSKVTTISDSCNDGRRMDWMITAIVFIIFSIVVILCVIFCVAVLKKRWCFDSNHFNKIRQFFLECLLKEEPSANSPKRGKETPNSDAQVPDSSEDLNEQEHLVPDCLGNNKAMSKQSVPIKRQVSNNGNNTIARE